MNTIEQLKQLKEEIKQDIIDFKSRKQIILNRYRKEGLNGTMEN